MATPDHTALVRPLNPFGGNSTQSPGRPFAFMDMVGESRQHISIRLSAVSLAINEITSLLADSEAFREALAGGVVVTSSTWPLKPACTENLFAAICFLSQFAETLRHEQRVVL